MRSKNALHVLLYEKALRLPMGTVQRSSPVSIPEALCLSAQEETDLSDNEGHIDLGLIVNLASEDILNVRELIWNIHYIWALPLKVLVLILLLYQKMGKSGAVGVVVGTLLIIPLQLITGKYVPTRTTGCF